MCDGTAGRARQCSRNLPEQIDVCSAGQGNRERCRANADDAFLQSGHFFAFCIFRRASRKRACLIRRLRKAGKGGELTCAHRTRQFGTVLRVSYGSRSIQCRVNDRGPFIRGRIVDLSVPAAKALGMMSAGVMRVSVE